MCHIAIQLFVKDSDEIREILNDNQISILPLTLRHNLIALGSCFVACLNLFTYLSGSEGRFIPAHSEIHISY